MFFSRRHLGASKEWLAINDMFYDPEKERFIKVRAFKFADSSKGLPLLRVDFVDDRSKQGMNNGFGMTVPEKDAADLVEAFTHRNEDGTFYNLVIDVIDHPYSG